MDCFTAAKVHLHVYGVESQNTSCGFSYLDIFSCTSGNSSVLLQIYSEFIKLQPVFMRRMEAKN